jgi:hypothetical protein
MAREQRGEKKRDRERRESDLVENVIHINRVDGPASTDWNPSLGSMVVWKTP